MEQKRTYILHLKILMLAVLIIFIPLLLSLVTQNFLILILGGVIAAAAFGLILFLILKPLNKLVEGAQTLGLGNLNFRLDIRSKDELERIAKSFNSMAEKLAQSFHKMEQEKDMLSSEKNRISAILASVVDGIIAVDFNKNIILLNKAAEQLTGYTLEETYGKPIDQFIHLFSEQEEIIPKIYCQTNFSQPLKLGGKDGKQAKVNLTTSSITEGVQTNLGCILIVHDLAQDEELEQMKLDFVSMASHELKTPLTSIAGYLSVFIDENKDKVPKEEMGLLDRSLTSTKQLLSLVGNILSVNKIERGQLSVAIETIDYTPILQKTIQDLQNQAKLKNINLTLTLPQNTLPKVLADPLRITEVIDNLVANAINYTQAGGKVDVSVQTTVNEVVTTIADSGVGIPQVALSHLFNKFFRVSNSLQQASKGTGLGLYISKSIIDKLHGKIWVESEVGKGSKFHFSLPITLKSSIDTAKFVSQSIQSGALNY